MICAVAGTLRPASLKPEVSLIDTDFTEQSPETLSSAAGHVLKHKK